MIQVRNFTKTYGAKTVVKDISFTASDGAITGFIGHNGAGKSTTIKAITGVIKPTEGEILLNGRNIQTDALEAKSSLAMCPTAPTIFCVSAAWNICILWRIFMTRRRTDAPRLSRITPSALEFLIHSTTRYYPTRTVCAKRL